MSTAEQPEDQSQQGYDNEEEGDDAWRNVADPNERRRIQNRVAQRKFRKPPIAPFYLRLPSLTVPNVRSRNGERKIRSEMRRTSKRQAVHVKVQMRLTSSMATALRVFHGVDCPSNMLLRRAKQRKSLDGRHEKDRFS